MDRLFADVRQAFRAMWRKPLVSLTAAATLTAGLTLAMLTYTIVDGVLVRPLPFPRGSELVSIYTEFRPESGYTFDRFALSAPEVYDYKAQNRTVDAAAWQSENVSIIGEDGTATPTRAIRASSDVFRVLEVPPLLGRVLGKQDDLPGASCSVVISSSLWRERFGGANDVVGRRIVASGSSCHVVGVMPDGFGFPSLATRMWLPLPLDSDPNTRGNHGLVAVGRLRNSETVETARTEVRTLMAAWEKTYPHHRGHGVVISALKDDLVGNVAQQLVVLAWAVAFVLLAIAGNLSALMLAHGEARRPEFAVRSALGASRASLVRQLLLEGWMVAVAAAATATLLASLLLEPVLRWSPVVLPRSAEIHLTRDGLLFAAGCAIVIGTLVALLPGRRLTRADISDVLKTSERGHAFSLRLRSQGLLVVSELALAAALTTGAILLTQSFVRLQGMPLGFDPDGVTTIVVSLPDEEGQPDSPQRFFSALIERLTHLPDVQAAGAISDLPLVDTPAPDDFTIDGRRVPEPSEPGSNAHYVMVTPGAFDALGIGVRRGRGIRQTDVTNSEGVAVINESAAATYWPGEDPIGRRIRYPTGVTNGRWSGWGPWLTIVGIAQDVRFEAPQTDPRPAIYVAHRQRPRAPYPGRVMAVVIRSNSKQSATTGTVRNIARELHPGAVVSNEQTLEAVVARAFARPRMMGWMMGVFALIGLSIAALGTYGVIAYVVARRTREIGLRMALGSSRGAVAWLFGRHTAVLLIAGLTVGAVVAAWMAQPMRAVLFGVQPLDPFTYIAVAAILALVVCAAVALPIRRAMTVDPIIALRAD